MKSAKQLIRKTHMEHLSIPQIWSDWKTKISKFYLSYSTKPTSWYGQSWIIKLLTVPIVREKWWHTTFRKHQLSHFLISKECPPSLSSKKCCFQCKACRRVRVAETSLVQKNGQISKPVWAKITQLHTERLTNSAIAKKLHISVSTVQRKLEQFTFKEDLQTSYSFELGWILSK